MRAMNRHDTMVYYDFSNTCHEVDLCYYCTRMKSLNEHGKCKYFGYIGKNCKGYKSSKDENEYFKRIVSIY